MNIRKAKLYLIIAGIVILIGIVLSFFIQRIADSQTTKLILSARTSQSKEYRLENVTSSAAQTQGLSGRSGLAENSGMLFSYDNVEKRCMWMKDMKFNIDIIWLDGNNRISSIVQDLSPSTYPQSYCADAKYVIELTAGEADKHNLRVGQVIKL